MADDVDKPKVNRQKGGLALVEVKEDGVLEVLVRNLDGQNEVKDELKTLIKNGEVEGDGKRTFGIILDVAETSSEDATYRETDDGKFTCLVPDCGLTKDSLRGLRIHQGKAHKST